MVDALFSAASSFAVVGWILLAVAPRWRWTERLVLSGLWSLLLSALYLALIVAFFPGSEGGFGSLAEVRTLFGRDELLLAGWVHYLAFDLLVGALLTRLGRASGLPHAVMIPILLLTFMLGPIGLIAFFLARSVRERRLAGVVA